jgi:GntR family transcriptional regulator
MVWSFEGGEEYVEKKLDSICKAASLELRPESPVPRYYQLSRFLVQLIQDEAFKTGDRFPTEEAIARYFNISRPTANKAIQLLLQEGFLSRDKGLGTFVREKPFIEFTFLGQSLSFADQFASDVPIKSKVIWVKTVPASKQAAEFLNLNEGEETVYMRRLRFVYNRPLMVCDSQLPAARFPGIENCEFVEESLYKTFAARYGSPVVRSERFASAIEATEPEVLQLLEIQPFSSILAISGVSYTVDDTPVDYLSTYLRQGVVMKTVVQVRDGATDR